MEILNRLCTHPDHPGVVLRPVMVTDTGTALCDVYDRTTGAPSPRRRLAAARLLRVSSPSPACL